MAGPIEVQCSECKAVLKLKTADAVGKRAKCPKCGQSFVVQPMPQLEVEEDSETESSDDDDFLGSLNELAQSSRPMSKPRPRPQSADDDDDEEEDDDDEIQQLPAQRQPRKEPAAPKPKKKRRRSREMSSAMVVVFWLLFGGTGALMGGILWGGLLKFMNPVPSPAEIAAVMEAGENSPIDEPPQFRRRGRGLGGVALIGAVAGFCGSLAGWGVRFSPGGRDGWAPGLVAGSLALASMLISHFVVVSILIGQVGDQVNEQFAVNIFGDQEMISRLASEVIEEFDKTGKTYVWPEGMDAELASEEADYPPEVWAEAKQRWEAKPAAEREAELNELRSKVTINVIDTHDAGTRASAYADSFRIIHFIWYGLAAWSGFFIGARVTTGE